MSMQSEDQIYLPDADTYAKYDASMFSQFEVIAKTAYK